MYYVKVENIFYLHSSLDFEIYRTKGKSKQVEQIHQFLKIKLAENISIQQSV